MNLTDTALGTLVCFACISLFLLIQHELHIGSGEIVIPLVGGKEGLRGGSSAAANAQVDTILTREEKARAAEKAKADEEQRKGKRREDAATRRQHIEELERKRLAAGGKEMPHAKISKGEVGEVKQGKLVCGGKEIKSEIVYWREVPGDAEYESPITPHHGLHHDRYLTFEYDQGGWNNARMGIECLIVVAHAMGRTLVVPPQQHLYLLGKTHKDQEDNKAHDEMGFEDFFDLELLYSHRGFHVMHMEDFLAKEGVTGGLHGKLPPHNSTEAWGPALWGYLDKVADYAPEWMGKFLAMPKSAGDWNMSTAHRDPKVAARMREFENGRQPVFYDDVMQAAHHIHFPADHAHRLLQHHYAFAFFADPYQQSFYKRFVRDYMRYKDSIQCSGHELLQLVRADALASAPEFGGDFYALHVRRGDFQFKEVKIGAADMVKNLLLPNGTSLIPRGALVYLSTDDPEGKCEHCVALKKPCESYAPGSKPVGCPEDTSWKAFTEAGWKVRFLHDYQRKGALKGVNPNLLGMVETIVCSRAKVFAGTYFSTFTGYIHRLRGYHGLGEATYYHSKQFRDHLQMKKSCGSGFSREWRAGWVDDEGGLI